MAGGDDDAPARAGHARLRTDRGTEVAVAQADRARPRPGAPLQRDAIAREWIELQAVPLTAYRRCRPDADRASGPEGSILKLQWSEANQRLTKLALELLGPMRRSAGEKPPTAASGSTRSCAAAATRSRRGNVRGSCATSSPSGYWASLAQIAHGFRLHARAGRAARAGARVPRRAGAVLEQLAELGWTGVSVSEEPAAPASASSRRRPVLRSSAAPSTTGPYFSTVALGAPARQQRNRRAGSRRGP